MAARGRGLGAGETNQERFPLQLNEASVGCSCVGIFFSVDWPRLGVGFGE